jgi:hypothetical protein
MKAISIILLAICIISAAEASFGRHSHSHHNDVQINRVTCNCAIKAFLVNQQCFCDDEAIEIQACLDKLSPNWPFLEEKDEDTGSTECPSPVSDPTGFQRCIDRGTPGLREDPKGDIYVALCSKNKTPSLASTVTPVETAGSLQKGNDVKGLVVLFLVSVVFMLLA